MSARGSEQLDDRPDVAVVIPAWNERSNLEVLVPQLQETLARIGVTSEIIVADKASEDGTMEAMDRLGARVVQQVERGYGGALIAGFAAARGRHVVTMDADLSHPAAFLEFFWRRREEADVLVASRYVPGGSAGTVGFRYVLSRILNLTFAILLWIPLKDLSSGFRMYRREVVTKIQPASRDFDVLEELLVRAYLGGASIRELPFCYQPRREGQSHAQLLKFGVAYVATILRLMPQRFGRNAGRRPVSRSAD